LNLFAYTPSSDGSSVTKPSPGLRTSPYRFILCQL
jgi:hypothetical protein